MKTIRVSFTAVATLRTMAVALCASVAVAGEAIPTQGFAALIPFQAERAVTLAGSGSMAVHALATTPAAVAAARDEMAKRSLSGLVTVAFDSDLSQLPYSDGLINVVEVDADALGKATPSQAEAMRIVAPRGMLRWRAGGTWTTTIKPFPAEMDEWSAYDKDGRGNNRSEDKIAGPPNGLRWLSPSYFSRSDGGVLTRNSVAIFPRNGFNKHDEVEKAKRVQFPNGLEARDAHNGALLWRMAMDRAPERHEIVITDDSVYCIPDDVGPVRRIALRTGTVGEAMAGFVAPPREPKMKEPDRHAISVQLLRVSDGVLLTLGGGTLYAVDIASNKVLWSKAVEDGRTPSWFVVDQGMVVLSYAKTPRFAFRGAYGMGVEALHGLKLRTGEVVWTQRDVFIRPADAPVRTDKAPTGAPTTWTPYTFRFVIADNSVFVPIAFVANGVDPQYSHGKGWSGVRLDLATGAIQWRSKSWIFPSGHYQVPLVSEGLAWVGNQTGASWDWKTGEPKGEANWGQSNAGCAELRAIPGYTLYDLLYLPTTLTTMNQKGSKLSEQVVESNAARSICDVGVFPANGLTYTVPAMCFCSDYQNGHLAMAVVPPVKPLPMAQRLVPGPAGVAAPKAMAGEAWPMHLGEGRRRSGLPVTGPTTLKQAWATTLTTKLPAGPLSSDWADNDEITGLLTAPVLAGDIAIACAPDRHEVIGIDTASGVERWRTRLGGRIDAPPALYQGTALVGCRDGRLVSLDIATGQVRWSFLAAPEERLIGVQSQLESAWPLMGSPLIQGNLVAICAGRHNRLDDGLWLWWLDALSGAVVHSARHAPQVKDYRKTRFQSWFGPLTNRSLTDARSAEDIASNAPPAVSLLRSVLRPATSALGLVSASKIEEAGPRVFRYGFGDMVSPRGFGNRNGGRYSEGQRTYGMLKGGRIAVLDRMAWVLNGGADHRWWASLTAYALDDKGAVDSEEYLAKPNEPKSKQKRPIVAWSYPTKDTPKGSELALGGPEMGLIATKDRLYLLGLRRLYVCSATNGSILGQADLPAAAINDGLAVANGVAVVTLVDGRMLGFR